MSLAGLRIVVFFTSQGRSALEQKSNHGDHFPFLLFVERHAIVRVRVS